MSGQRTVLQREAARLLLSTVLSVGLAALLAATIVWTLFDPRWVPFLGGVLFAALLSMISDVSKARWALARRVRQVERLRGRLDEANTRSASSTRAFAAAETRLRCLGNVLRSMVLFIDRHHVCRFHNRAAADKLGLADGVIDGRPLRELLGPEFYQALRPHLENSLAGQAESYRLRWRTPANDQVHYAVRQLPPDPEDADGELCLLITPVESSARGAPRDSAPDETFYVRAVSRQLTGWDDAKEKLTEALAQDRFVLVEQRIKPLEPGGRDPLCVEVLLRLQEEEDNLLPPGGFLAEAERVGMMEELDRWVVHRLITLCQERQKREPGWRPPLYCVNLSGAAVRSAAFARYVQQQLQTREFDGRGLCFEIAEHEVLSLHDDVHRLIGMLAPCGCRFTLDAFGSVRGSFAPLKDLAFAFVKIDGVIVQNLLRDPAVLARADAIARACRSIGVRSIAEFVEEPETLAALRKVGVDYVQGFGISQPVRIAARKLVPLAA